MPIIHTRTRSPGALRRRPAPAPALALALALALAPALTLVAPLDAYASGGDGNGNRSAVRVGNGSENRNLVTIGSTRLRGVLHQFSSGVGGVSSVQGGLCRPRGRFCTLSQHIKSRGPAGDESEGGR
ncbi:hypothetical protein OHB01_09115 [Microbispora hainanensis]|uniref:hypothetical protein n=1 Tax=Microbispora TaxID=2005 RepID=UPI00115742D2|nr:MULTISPECIES: hypothetical protein [Microbispora]NJP28478.1 hypothetical protein [Microbispora sp. CL1-1]TQS08334.1 hypothetical protein FLW53_30640 [Microbispora sp. SCL1-1]